MTYLPDESKHTAETLRSVWDVVVIGGGAAGFFAALHAQEAAQAQGRSLSILIVESAARCLGKVRISGGGRCNVTHDCPDVGRLPSFYPRGQKALKGVFHRFAVPDTIAWFAHNGVTLKTEPDGRMFPVTDSSETIIDALESAAEVAGIKVYTQCPLQRLRCQESGLFAVETPHGVFGAHRVVLATGSARRGAECLAELGHQMVSPVPSLFTFCVPDTALTALAGLSLPEVKASLRLGEKGKEKFEQTGPLLVTHWGVSGPAVLKLSAWAARALASVQYKAELLLDLAPSLTAEGLYDQALAKKKVSAGASAKFIVNDALCPLPKRFWAYVLDRLAIPEESHWSALSDKQLRRMAETLKALPIPFEGKSTHKDEFVTAGGLDLGEVTMSTLESRRVPGLYVVGELLDIDGVTGGFNFQNAWSTGALAGRALAQSLLDSPT